MRLASVHTYPIKSCRGTESRYAVVEPWGLANDRRWMVVDGRGDLVTARELPRLLLAHPTVTEGGGLTLTGPELPRLDVAVPGEATARTSPVRVWRSVVDAVDAGPAAAEWFGELLGRDVHLVHLADPRQRPTNPEFTDPGDRVSFADGYPLLLTTTASLDALNDGIAAGPRGDEGPLPMTRFRPSVVVSGSEAWAEDGWRRVRIGEATFRAVKGCDRCVMTTIDPLTAAKGKEPIATLARMRRWDGATWFGMNLVPDTPGPVVTRGDEVEVLESVPAPDGPPR